MNLCSHKMNTETNCEKNRILKTNMRWTDVITSVKCYTNTKKEWKRIIIDQKNVDVKHLRWYRS